MRGRKVDHAVIAAGPVERRRSRVRRHGKKGTTAHLRPRWTEWRADCRERSLRIRRILGRRQKR